MVTVIALSARDHTPPCRLAWGGAGPSLTMCAVHARGVGQRQQLAERGPHLLWRALEQPPAAQRKQSVACKKGVARVQA